MRRALSSFGLVLTLLATVGVGTDRGTGGGALATNQLGTADGRCRPSSFAAEPVPGAVSYQITVVSYDLLSLGQMR
jgi:hypothetical protein